MAAMMGRADFRFKQRNAILISADNPDLDLEVGRQWKRAMTDLKTLYELDTVAWADNQAAALRVAARNGSNQELDWENLAEEIEDLGKSRKRELHSHIRNIIEHLIKLGHSPAKAPRSGWRESIERARVEIDALLEENPSLKPRVDEFIREEIPRGVKLAIASLDAHGELSNTLRQALRAKSYLDLFSYTPDQVLGDWFPPEPQG
jgi:hypothetical protein